MRCQQARLLAFLTFCYATKLEGCVAWKPRLFARRNRRDDNNSKNAFPSMHAGGSDASPPPSPSSHPVRQTLRDLKKIAYYKPPVGIVTLYCVARLIFSGRIFRLYANDAEKMNNVNSAAEVLQYSEKSHRNRRRRYEKRHKRALDLDLGDSAYDYQGGVGSVRRQLCHAVVRGIHEKDPDNAALKHLMAAIHVTYDGQAPRVDYVKEIVSELLLLQQEELRRGNTMKNYNDDEILDMTRTLAEARAIDATMRVARDRLLITCSKLKRLVKYWRRRVRVASKLSRVANAVGLDYLQDDRDRLALAVGAYDDELERLGKAESILRTKMPDLSGSLLVEALALSRTDTSPQKHSSWVSKLAIRYNAEGKGRLQVRWFDQSTRISSDAARQVLGGNAHSQWTKQTQNWIQESRMELCGILKESVQKNIVDEDTKCHVANLGEWCFSTVPDTTEQWDSALELVHRLDEYQRVGEGTVLRLRDPKAVQTMEGLNLFGVPSSLAVVGVARVIHEVLQPRWPEIKDWLHSGWMVAWSIVHERVWNPLKDIFVSLSSRQNKSLLEFFNVDNEVESLDTMLRDLGFGDGTEATRQHALVLATRRYEKDLEEGLMRNALGGRLIRLLLVQVQQLKAGLLHALESIDVLVAANRLNAHILAAFPALLIVTIGFRVVARSLYTFRIKAIRSIRDVHAEMADCLDEMEKILVQTTEYNHLKLGEFVLHMHSYLILLDYCASLFPARSLDAIHKSMQDILSIGYDPATQMAKVQTLKLVKEKHAGLVKYL